MMIKPFKHQWDSTGFLSWVCPKCGCLRKRFSDQPIYYYFPLGGRGWTKNRPNCKLNTEK